MLVEYKPPPYPMYKAYFVPYWDERTGEFWNARKVEQTDVENWNQALEKLRHFVRKACECSEVEEKVERLELIGDLIALFFKIPLLLEPIPTLVSSLKGYLCWRLLPRELRDKKAFEGDFIAFAKEMVQAVEISRYQKEIEDLRQLMEENREKIERCWFTLPADTRPVFNTSGLIPHSLTTSALAWAHAIENGCEREEVAIIRLAALLHDIGKPFAPMAHVEASVEIAEKLLSDILDQEDLEKVCEAIRDHHRKATSWGKFIGWADFRSSASDRVQRLFDEYLKRPIEEKLRRPVQEQELDSWEFWKGINEKYPEAIYSWSVDFVKKVKEDTENFLKPLQFEPVEPVEGVEFACIDIGGIQEFIRTPQELKAVGAASFALDVLVMVYLPAFIQEDLKRKGVWFPSEAFLYTAGGNVFFILPEKLENDIKSSLEKVKGANSKLSIRFRAGFCPFKVIYTLLSQDLAKEMGLKKLEVGHETVQTRVGFWLCHTCKRPIEREGNCESCEKLTELGSQFHFKKRWESSFRIGDTALSPKMSFGEWERASKYLMEFLAGHDIEELQRGERRRSYAVVKVDGNLMGAFIGTSVSLTDMYERSARVDIALKKSFEKSIQECFESLETLDPSVAKKVGCLPKLGLLYMGGDDALMLVPSWLAPVFALSIGHKFRNYLGQARGLSIGIAAGKAKAPVWSLISAADVLEEEAKKKARGKPTLSSICFDISEITLSDSSVRYRRNDLQVRRITQQPFLIGEGEKMERILALLSGREGCREWYKWSYSLSRFGETEEHTRERNSMKRVRNILREALTKAESLFGDRPASQNYVVATSVIYLRRQLARIETEKKREYQIAYDLVPEGWGEEAVYGDVDLLIKMLGGGAI